MTVQPTPALPTSVRSSLPTARPPRMRGLPIVGLFPMFARSPLRFLESVAAKGDFVDVPFIGRSSYVVSSPDVIEETLVTKNKSFVKDMFLRGLKGVVGEGLLTSEGEAWRRQRRLIQPAFHRERIAAYATQMVARTESTVAAWRADAALDIHAEMMRTTLEIVSQTLFSSEATAAAADVEEAVTTVMALFGDPVFTALPWLRALPVPSTRRFHKAVQTLDGIIYPLIEKRRREGLNTRNDLLATLLAAKDEDGSQMSDRQIRDEVLTLYLAGHETTALALSWTFWLLGQHPRIEAEAAEEARGVLRGRSATIEDVPRLPYLDRVVKESMRLYPPAWSVGREAAEDTELGGYVVPRGQQVWMSQWIVHRDPRWYYEPLAFRPDRWADGLEKRIPRYAYFPFGGGPRLCIGNVFASVEATLVLATVLSRFRLELVPDQVVEPFPSITLRPKQGVKVVVRRRG